METDAVKSNHTPSPVQVDGCPFVGLVDDKSTHFGFAHASNACYHDGAPQSIPLPHQAALCLTGDYARCPLFSEDPGSTRSRRGVSLPSFSARPRITWPWVLLAFAAVASLLVMLFATGSLSFLQGLPVFAAYTPTSAVLVQDSHSAWLPYTVIHNPATSPADLPVSGFSGTQTPFSPGQPGVAPSETAVSEACGRPDGWVLYFVRPGDTLGALGRKLGVSAQALVSANCLSSRTIYTGQMLYLPRIPYESLPTSQPPVYNSPTRTSPPPTSVPPTSEPPTSEPPTPVPPTAVPPTSPPPAPTELVPPTPAPTATYLVPKPFPTNQPPPPAIPTITEPPQIDLPSPQP